MQKGDRTGPMGMGPMTERGMGYCNPNGPVYSGYGCYGGSRRGFRNFRGATGFQGRGMFGSVNQTGMMNDKSLLQNRAEYLKRSLEEIEKQLSEFDD